MHLTAGILGLIGNTMVFIAFALSKRLQTKTNMFVVNLAFADFLTSILMPIFAWSLIADVLFPVPEWIDTMCALAIGAAQGSVGCSLVTLSLIAMNRLILITRKRKTYERIYRNRNVAIFICIAWLYPFACEIIPLLFGIGELGFDEVAHICGTKTNHEHSYIYDVLVVGLLIPVPLLIISYSYARIFCFIRIHNKQLGEHRQPSRDCSRVRTVSGVHLQVNNSENSQKMNKKLQKQVDISKNLFYVFVTYIICLTPHLLAEVVNAGPYVITQTKVLVVCNSFANPILYGLKHPHFRKVFACIVKCRWQDVPQPSWILRTTTQLHSKSQGNSNMMSHVRSSANDGPTPTI